MSTPTPANDLQVGGTHYKTRAIQPWDFSYSQNLNFLMGNVVKYVTRAPDKNGVEDLTKAEHYLHKQYEEACREKLFARVVLRYTRKLRLTFMRPIQQLDYCAANGVRGEARAVILGVIQFENTRNADHLRTAIVALTSLIKDTQNENPTR